MTIEMDESGYNPPPESAVATLPKPAHKREVLTEKPNFSLEDAQRMAAQSGFRPPVETTEPDIQPTAKLPDTEGLEMLQQIGLVRPDVIELDPHKQSALTEKGEREQEEFIGERPTAGIKPATPEQVAEFEEGIKTKQFRGMEVVDETGSGNARALELRDPKTGKTILWRLQQTEGMVQAGELDPLPLNFDINELTDHIMGEVESYESAGKYDEINEPLVSAFIRSVRTYASKTVTKEERETLANKTLLRLRLALLEKQAVYGDADGFASGANQWGREGLQYITVTLDKDPTIIDPATGKEKNPNGENLKVRVALEKFEEGDGEYFRYRTRKQQDDKKKQMSIDLVAMGMTKEKADLSVKLAEKVMKVTGQATFYGGPVYPPGHARAGRLIEQDIIDTVFGTGPGARQIDMTDERYWQEWKRVRREVDIQIVPTTIEGHVVPVRDPVTGAPVINPVTGRPEQTFRLGHTTQAIFKNTFFTPEALTERPVPELASELFISTETRVRSYVFFQNKRKLTEVVDTINDDVTGIEGSINFLGATSVGTWAGMVKGGNDLKKKLTDGDKPFLLYSPFNNPNAAYDDPAKAMEAMNPFVEVARSYEYLANYRRLDPATGLREDLDIEGPTRAKLELVGDLLSYLDNPEAYTKFGYKKWNSNLKQIALDGLKKQGLLDTAEVKQIKQHQKVSADKAAVQAFGKEGGEGLPAKFIQLLRLIKWS